MDLEAARALASSERAEELSAVVCFRAHQAAERYMKGLIVAADEEPPRIHALPELLRRAIAHASEPDTEQLRTAASGPNTYYIPSRYQIEVGGPEGPITISEATEALSWAEAIAAELRSRLESR